MTSTGNKDTRQDLRRITRSRKEAKNVVAIVCRFNWLIKDDAFKMSFTDRFIQAGIAKYMIGMAAGNDYWWKILTPFRNIAISQMVVS